MTSLAFRSLFAVAAVTLAFFSASAQAKLVPNDRISMDSSALTEDAVIYAGPIGATATPGYFPVTPARPPSAMCRWEMFFVSQPFRLARACE